ncbi:AT-hook motif nuclear-localized protein 1-like isoform X1 [Macadamia integrifolia]|uniref:AT-hook motif nuclear-localized protein 1-like isoform X1 n=1 Tax=Macadamia integrifolia TaxID=60698 RepID=UPI001C4EDAE1|nr:AT-hook motif nuclear-localized protein 1-like isoform X1 [Macadamia integrifolia]
MERKEITVSSSTANRETDSPLSQPLPIAVVVPQEKGKKKRGRPRMYGPEGSLAAAASQGVSLPPSEFARGPPAPLATGSGNQQLIPHFGPEESTSSAFFQGFATPASEFSPKQIRGPRPRNSGDRKPTPPLSELLANVEGRDFTPHVLTIHTGENVAAKLISLIGPRDVCILSANGFVSNVAIRQPGSFGGILTFEIAKWKLSLVRIIWYQSLASIVSHLPTLQGKVHEKNGMFYSDPQAI